MLHSDGVDFKIQWATMNSTAAIRVLIVDDDSLVRQLLTQILTAYADIEVVGQAATGDEAISSVERVQPNIVIMDIRMPRMDGVAATREITLRYPQVKVIGLTEYAQGYNAEALERAGALAVYHKSKAPEELYQAIKQVC
jgi:DNA-binding NarL/FixJ family response regulator